MELWPNVKGPFHPINVVNFSEIFSTYGPLVPRFVDLLTY
jgi:hypothetical protein